MNKQVWVMVIMTLAFFTFRVASAEDVYNFYFQKGSGPETVIQGAPGNNGQKVVKKKKKKEIAEEEVEEEENEEIEQFDDNDLGENSVVHVAKKEENPQRGQRGRRWTIRAGFGAVGYSGEPTAYYDYGSPYGYGNFGYAGAQNDSGVGSFVVGANLHFNRYVDMDLELQFMDKEQRELSNFRGPLEGSLGLGLTPIHLNLFGREFLRIGAVGGYMVGHRFVDEAGNAIPSERAGGLFIGPRIDLAFTDKLGVQLAARLDQSHKDFFHSSLTLTYDF